MDRVKRDEGEIGPWAEFWVVCVFGVCMCALAVEMEPKGGKRYRKRDTKRSKSTTRKSKKKVQLSNALLRQWRIFSFSSFSSSYLVSRSSRDPEKGSGRKCSVLLITCCCGVGFFFYFFCACNFPFSRLGQTCAVVVRGTPMPFRFGVHFLYQI